MTKYEIADDGYCDVLMAGDRLADATVFPDSVWQKYQELLEEIRQVRAGLR